MTFQLEPDNKSQRTIWMFPRNQRTSYPYDVSLSLRAISNAIARQPNRPLNQQEQNEVTKQLRKLDIADGEKLRDINSGGFRTWLSYFEQMNLLYFETIGTSPRKKVARLTQAGATMAALNDPVKELRYSLARMQYPSPYSLSPNVQISRNLRVRPVLFLQQMASTPELAGNLYNSDIFLACLYGHNHDKNTLKKVVKKCVTLRLKKYENKSELLTALKEQIDNPKEDLFTNRTRKVEFELDKRIEDVWNIANTLANRLATSGILIRETADSEVGSKYCYSINPGVVDILLQVEKEKITSESDFHSHADWQRKLGRGSRKKDTRRTVSAENYHLESPTALIEKRILTEYRESGLLFDRKKLIKDLIDETTRPAHVIEGIMDRVLPSSASDLERQLYDSAINGDKNRIFEKSIASFLSTKFPKSLAEHTGQQKKSDGIGGFADVFFHATNHQCLIIDAKASNTPYSLPASDQRAMIDYANDSHLLFKHEEDTLSQAIFVVSSAKPTVKDHLNSMSKRTSVPVGVLRIRELIELVNQHAPDAEAFSNYLLSKATGFWGH